MLAECLKQGGREGFVVLAGVTAVGEHLGKGLLVVDAHKLLVLRQLLLGGVVGIDVGGCVVVVGLVVDDGGQGQTVGERRLLVGPSQGDGGHGHHQARQLQRVDDELGHVDGGAEIAQAQSLGLGKVAERLAVEQGIGGGVDEREEIVVAGIGLPVVAPYGGAPEVGTEGEHDGCLGHHGLVEMSGCEPLLHLRAACDDDAVEL